VSCLLAVDPGVTCPGAALFDLETNRLVGARYWRGPGFHEDAQNIAATSREVARWARVLAGTHGGVLSEVAFEWMVMRGRQGAKNVKSLAPVWTMGGFVAGMVFPAVPTIYKPGTWKGSKKPNPTAAWVISRLDKEERRHVEDLPEFELALVRADSVCKDVTHLAHNAIDAVGIGLHHLGRLGPRRVIVR
jgi:hypothetical protein